MGLGLWAIVAMFAAVATLAGVLIGVAGIRARAQVAILLGALLAAPSAIVLAASAGYVVLWLALGNKSSSGPDAFRRTFGFEPGSDVAAVRGSSYASTDSHSRFLAFRCSPRTIEAVTMRRWQPAPPAECERRLRQSSQTPDWWRMPRFAQCHTTSPFDPATTFSQAWLGYDPASGEARFHSIAID